MPSSPRSSRRHDDVAEAAAACVALALEAGTRDNVTVVVCDVFADDAPLASARRVRAAEPDFYGAAAARFTEGLESA